MSINQRHLLLLLTASTWVYSSGIADAAEVGESKFARVLDGDSLVV
jgi:hypothetical protein